jgi:hypothetical protein
MAIVQLRNPTEGRAYYDRKKDAGKTSMEAMRCVKRRLSDETSQACRAAYVAVLLGPSGPSCSR